MKKALQWLHDNRSINISIVVFLSILYPLIHDTASKPFNWAVAQFGHKTFHLYLNVFFIVILISLVYLLYSKIKVHPERKHLCIYGSATLLCILTAYATLMPYRSEGIHFIQYGLLGIIVTPLAPSLFYAIVLTTFVGYLDEYYQYFITEKYYLDFNDLVLNIFGSAMGVIIAYGLWRRPTTEGQKYNFKNIWGTPYSAIFMLALIVLAGLGFGYFSVFIDASEVYPLARHTEEIFDRDFWYTVSFDVTWHRIRTYPGLLIMCLLPLLYLRIDNPIK